MTPEEKIDKEYEEREREREWERELARERIPPFYFGW
jgi:hypothetical protein